MASIYRHGKGWRVQLYVAGSRESATFPTKQQAAAWAVQREAELSGARLPDKTVGDAMARFAADTSPGRRGGRWEAIRLQSLQRDALARKPLARLTGPDIAAWRDARLQEVAPATVAREMALIRTVLETARKDWGWLRDRPMAEVRVPRSPPSRKRRVSQDEIDRVTLALGVTDTEAATSENRTGLAFLFAVETAMRAGEILGMTWADVRAKAVTLPRTKNGDVRDVPLSPRAREILAALPRDRATCFDVNPGTRDALFRRAVKASQIPDLHFHDSRAEAIWRLSRKLDVLELARVIGHRDPRSLLLYYNTSADDLADRL
jgi:integrase